MHLAYFTINTRHVTQLIYYSTFIHIIYCMTHYIYTLAHVTLAHMTYYMNNTLHIT